MPNTPVWLFDLDNTLHNASPHIFPHINRSMTRYLEQHLGLTLDEANALRMQYWHRYGATMLGLNADEIIQTIGQVMAAGGTWRGVRDALPVHPTVTEFLPTVLDRRRPLLP